MDLKILLVDDQPASVEPLRAELEKTRGTTVKVVNFDDFQAEISKFAPNLIVLDLAQGNPADENVPGTKIFEQIWSDNFCPLVIYTAVPDHLESDKRLPHPFVKLEKKGGGSVERVIAQIRQFEPHMSAVEKAGFEVQRVLNQALKEVAPRIFATTQDVDQQKEMLVRSARRRVAAAMDKELSTGGPPLRSWEHYLSPPTGPGHPLTGDIIRNHAGQADDPSQYAVILTPSCDLVSEGRRKPKVGKVLVARCKGVDRLLQEFASADRGNGAERKIKLRTILTRGHGQSCLPVPGLPGVFPSMAADFRDLELISHNEIADDGKPYDRIASVDSPFRELVAWAYVLCAARPGVPDRDYDAWVEEIVSMLPEPRVQA